ncbi:hypothetical protein HDU86_001040 [Geranomyces michiganensis]|nr:hypothetical protein HDU86_001040 [Geranomyces michiganensis]
MFPKQFGLTSVLSPELVPPVLERPDRAIKPKVHWRLKKARDLVQHMQVLHSRCNYRALLDHHCPLLVSSSNGRPSILNTHSSYYQVYSFVRAVITQVIPDGFWGSNHNQDMVFKAIDTFIRLRRYETMSLQNVVKRVKTKDCKWAASADTRNGKVKWHTPLSESNKRKELVYQYLYWLFESFLIPLLKTNFYATESAPFRNKVFYFRHELWHKLTSKVRANLSATIFRPIDQTDTTLDSSRALGYSYIRLLPKDSGMRMITNLRRRFLNKPCRAMHPQTAMEKSRQQQQNGLSINNILQNAFHVLSFEKV